MDSFGGNSWLASRSPRITVAFVVLAAVLVGGAAQNTPQAAAAAPVQALSSPAGAQGDLVVSVGHLLFGQRLHLKQWPAHPRDRVKIRIDIWVAPNTTRPRLVWLKADGVAVVGCTGWQLRRGTVNRLRCTMIVPPDPKRMRAHIRIRVCTGQGVFEHSYLVRIAPIGGRP
jgi:hypothetical protein